MQEQQRDCFTTGGGGEEELYLFEFLLLLLELPQLHACFSTAYLSTVFLIGSWDQSRLEENRALTTSVQLQSTLRRDVFGMYCM